MGAADRASVDPNHRRELRALTSSKAVASTALRWVSPFLPTLERAFGASTGTLTGIMGGAELTGLSTSVTGRFLDRGHERRMIIAGLFAVCASSLVALGGTTTTFALSFVLLAAGTSNLTIAGHAWIGHRIAFKARGRAIGTYEMSWALALLVGAPILALLIYRFGWRGPYIALVIASLVGALVIWKFVAASPKVVFDRTARRLPIPRQAFPPMFAAAATASAGIGIFVVSGAWLDDRYGVSTAGLGFVAAGFGAIELVSSGSVALISDRIGARRSVLGGLGLLLLGALIMSLAGGSLALAIVGLVTYTGGFEYAIVSAMSLITEAAPNARGRTIGLSNSLGTIARATSVIASGQLYEAFGIAGSLSMATGAAVVAIILMKLTTVGDAEAHPRPVPRM